MEDRLTLKDLVESSRQVASIMLAKEKRSEKVSLHPHPKIHQVHLDRYCVIYIRQSCLKQVIFNTASTARQYDFQLLAIEYGWLPEKIIIIDEDQGITGTIFGDRAGFRQICEQVSQGRIGAVCAIELSRLSRDDFDLAQMVSNCRWTDTLLIDEEGVYDPKEPNDLLLLGIKGTLGAAEHNTIKARLVGGIRKRAAQGTYRTSLPPGFIYDPVTKELILDPDLEVQRVVRLFFDLFKEIGTANGVYKEFERINQLFPSRSRSGLNKGKLVWRPMTLKLAQDILHHPTYAGAYVYGRKKTVYLRMPGELLKFKSHQVQLKRNEWAVLKLDHHEGYILWDHYLLNEQRLEDNKSKLYGGHRGTLGPGSALLQKIAICGDCGRGLQIKYPRGNYSLYQCLTKGCHTFTGQSRNSVSVDKEVERVLLKAIEPAQLIISIDSLKQVQASVHERDRQWTSRIARAEREAKLAEAEFHQADPENRRVKSILERKWEEKLGEIDRLKLEQMKQREIIPPVLDEANCQAILALAQDVPKLWYAATTTNVQRKTLLGFLIENVTLRREKAAIHISITWRTKAYTELRIPLPKIKKDYVRTDPKVLSKICELAANHSDQRIAEVLNEAGIPSAKGNKFTVVAIRSLRFKNKIKTACPDIPTNRHMLQRGDGLFTTKGAALQLNVSVQTIQRWCKEKILHAIQSKEKSALWIDLTPETIERLKVSEKLN